MAIIPSNGVGGNASNSDSFQAIFRLPFTWCDLAFCSILTHGLFCIGSLGDMEISYVQL